MRWHIEWIVHYKLSIWGTHLWKTTYKMKWNDTASSASQVRLHEISRARGQGAQSFQVKRSNQRIAYPDDHDRITKDTAITCYHCHNQCSWQPKYTEYLILLTSKVAYWFLLTFVIYIYILYIYIYIVMTPPPVAQFQKTLLPCQSRWLWILSWAIYVKKKGGIDGSTPFKTGQLSHLCPKKWHMFCHLLRWFLPNFFLNIKLLFWDIDGATPELHHLCGHSQPDFGEMTEVVLSAAKVDTL